jgi:heme exporter protein C
MTSGPASNAAPAADIRRAGAVWRVLGWVLWLWIALAIAGAFLWAPLAQSFIGQSSRILFFHVPMAWASFVAFLAAGVWSVLHLVRRNPDDDRAAAAAVELGLLFAILATVTGSMWAKVMWHAWWNGDPRQTSIVVALVFYGAYLVLRGAVEDPEQRGRLCAAYAVLGLVVAPYLYFVAPRTASFTLHPQPVVNAAAKVEVESRMLTVLLASSLGFTALFFWVHRLRLRLLRVDARRATRNLPL